MNFLAHAFLAGDAPTDRLGGIIGDFVKGVLPGALPPDLAEGVRLHRRIDVFADSHAAFRRSCLRISPARRRVAGIVVDMVYDHFLARHWAQYSDVPLSSYTAEVYALMARHHDWLPPRLAALFPSMRTDDWLAAYAEMAVVQRALDRMALRMRRPELLAGSGAELQHHYAALEADFHAFLPDAQAFAASQRRLRGGAWRG